MQLEIDFTKPAPEPAPRASGGWAEIYTRARAKPIGPGRRGWYRRESRLVPRERTGLRSARRLLKTLQRQQIPHRAHWIRYGLLAVTWTTEAP